MLKGFLALFLQQNCPLCDRTGNSSHPLCAYCEKQLQRMKQPDPSQFWQGELPLFVWGVYGGILKRAIAAMKYDDCSQLAQLLGLYLGKAWLDSPLSAKAKAVTVVPIPLHPKKQQQRGFNQAELIGRGFCQYTGLTLQPAGLIRQRETQAMFGLTADEREQNVAKAFILGKPFQRRLPRAPVLLIDDIHTTGATVRTAAQTLRQSGITVLGVAAVAKPKRGDRGSEFRVQGSEFRVQGSEL